MSSLLTIKEWEQVAREADFSAAKMAFLFSVSQKQPQRLFRQHLSCNPRLCLKHLHCTPSRWLRELQCRLAKQLIARGYTNKAAAAELKFSSESHFCREFKKKFGTSPQSFAQNHATVVDPKPLHRLSQISWEALRAPAAAADSKE